MRFPLKKLSGIVRNWFKRNVFVTPLKPRPILAFSFVSICIAMLPFVVAKLAFMGMMDATYVYNDTMTMPSSSVIFVAIVLLLSIAIIVYSIVQVVKVTLRQLRKRKKIKDRK